MTHTQKRVLELISRCLETPVQQIGLESTWKEQGADSLDLVEVVLALEDELDIRFAPAELQSLKTVSDLLAAVERLAPDSGDVADVSTPTGSSQ